MIRSVLLLALIGTALAGRRRERLAAETPPSAIPAAPVERHGKLFPNVLPLDAGPVDGLVHTSAQVCAGCHPVVVDQWMRSAHAGSPSAVLRDAAIGEPGCLGCHLPLASQTEGTTAFDATLTIEGVTCAACHVRDGAIVTGDLQAATHDAAHGLLFSQTLARSEACAACHQLTWPGASEPLYDTYGEWQRSGFADLSISCLDCHLYGGVDGSVGADHALSLDPGRAVTVQLELPSLRLVRGEPPLNGIVRLTNTGSGHTFPTGSPFRAVRVRASLVPPDGGEEIALVTADLARRIEPVAPFRTKSDTRLEPGAAQSFPFSLTVPLSAPPGRWTLRVALTRTVQGQPVEGAPLVDRSWPVVVE